MNFLLKINCSIEVIYDEDFCYNEQVEIDKNKLFKKIQQVFEPSKQKNFNTFQKSLFFNLFEDFKNKDTFNISFNDNFKLHVLEFIINNFLNNSSLFSVEEQVKIINKIILIIKNPEININQDQILILIFIHIINKIKEPYRRDNLIIILSNFQLINDKMYNRLIEYFDKFKTNASIVNEEIDKIFRIGGVTLSKEKLKTEIKLENQNKEEWLRKQKIKEIELENQNKEELLRKKRIEEQLNDPIFNSEIFSIIKQNILEMTKLKNNKYLLDIAQHLINYILTLTNKNITVYQLLILRKTISYDILTQDQVDFLYNIIDNTNLINEQNHYKVSCLIDCKLNFATPINDAMLQALTDILNNEIFNQGDKIENNELINRVNEIFQQPRLCEKFEEQKKLIKLDNKYNKKTLMQKLNNLSKKIKKKTNYLIEKYKTISINNITKIKIFLTATIVIMCFLSVIIKNPQKIETSDIKNSNSENFQDSKEYSMSDIENLIWGC